MFYGPVGGAHCLLKWCFNGPTVTMAHTHTHTQNTEPVGEGGNPGGEGVGEEKQEKERQQRRTRQTLMRECVLRVCKWQEISHFCTLGHDRTVCGEHSAQSARPFSRAVTSRVILKLLKTMLR